MRASSLLSDTSGRAYGRSHSRAPRAAHAGSARDVRVEVLAFPFVDVLEYGYVIGEVWQAMRRVGHRELGLWLLVAAFMAGVVTDMVLTYGGA
jgi:hypothetical protein